MIKFICSILSYSFFLFPWNWATLKLLLQFADKISKEFVPQCRKSNWVIFGHCAVFVVQICQLCRYRSITVIMYNGFLFTFKTEGKVQLCVMVNHMPQMLSIGFN